MLSLVVLMKPMTCNPKQLCGIDEAGRGPIAGPLVVAGCILHQPIEGLNDSKKLTAKKREALFILIKAHSDFHIVSKSAQEIDTLGLSKCMHLCLEEILSSLTCNEYLFDGNTNFGIKELPTQIKADADVCEVSAASILAKVSRDAIMVEYATHYPNYHFEKHKGYGTALHVETIKKYGYCEIHRKSFKLKALEATLF